MKVIDPGHKYSLQSYDGEEEQTLQFMKREGAYYPGNTSSYPGTNCQEVIKVLIDRIDYLNKQLPDVRNTHIRQSLVSCLWLLERRAAEKHGVSLPGFPFDKDIETWPTCPTCGHVVCGKNCKKGKG